MNIGHFVEYINHHYELVGAVSIGGIILGAVYFLTRQIFGSNQSVESGINSTEFKKVEESMKLLLEQIKTSGVPQAASSTTAPPASNPSVVPEGSQNSVGPNVSEDKLKEYEALSGKLSEKEKEIDKLKAEVQKLGGEAGGGEELKTKLTELEAKLAEYEIIEDDIADLSFFKEENERLKKELEALKSSGVSVGTPSLSNQSNAETVSTEAVEAPASALENAIAEVSETPAPELADEAGGLDQSDFDKQFASDLEEALKESPAPAESGINQDSLDALMMEAEKEQQEIQAITAAAELSAAEAEAEAEAEEKEKEKPEAVEIQAQVAAAPTPVPAKVQAAAPAPPPEEQKDVIGDDIMAEFSGLEEFRVEDESVNTDKMLEEVTGLDEDSEGGLDENLDVERMAREAESLGIKS